MGEDPGHEAGDFVPADEPGDLAVGSDGSLGNLPNYGQDLVCEIFSETGRWCHVTAPPSAPPTSSPACR